MQPITLDEYMKQYNVYAHEILVLDKNAPATNDIKKMATILSSDTTLDAAELIKLTLEYMKNQNESFEVAIRAVRDTYRKE